MNIKNLTKKAISLICKHFKKGNPRMLSNDELISLLIKQNERIDMLERAIIANRRETHTAIEALVNLSHSKHPIIP